MIDEKAINTLKPNKFCCLKHFVVASWQINLPI